MLFYAKIHLSQDGMQFIFVTKTFIVQIFEKYATTNECHSFSLHHLRPLSSFFFAETFKIQFDAQAFTIK
jgi:hypothetical protein